MRTHRKQHPGIRARHRTPCRTFEGDDCNCSPAWEAWVFHKRTGTKLRKTFPTLAAAKSWRQDALPAIRKGSMAAPSRLTLREAAEDWLGRIERGDVLSRRTRRASRRRGPTATWGTVARPSATVTATRFAANSSPTPASSTPTSAARRRRLSGYGSKKAPTRA